MNDAAMTETEAKKVIKLKDDLIKLFNHPTFKKVISEGYFKAEPARIAQALTNSEMQDETDQRSLGEMLRAVGHLNNYLTNVIREGRNVELQLEEHKKELLESQKMSEVEVEVDPITGEEIVINEEE